MTTGEGSEVKGKTVVRTVFLALILDLLAFTLPLPLFPRLIAWYLQHESQSSSTLLARLLALSYSWRESLVRLSPLTSYSRDRDGSGWSSAAHQADGRGKNWDVVLLGGAMGSLFSLCQCIISPWLGSLSDRYGRKRILLLTMLGNIASALIWLRSTSFSTYLLSRLVGGLSEGNVQISTAIISDVTTEATRSRSLALIGIAFSICFTLGPSIGAYFASRPIPLADANGWNVFALPAAISIALLSFETLYLAAKLPETRSWRTPTSGGPTAQALVDERGTVETRLSQIRAIGRLHGLFLLFFSGAEFTLTFLTYDLFAASNAENGRLLSFIGILSALLQARHVRPSMARLGELRLAFRGVVTCILALALLALLPLSPIKTSPTVSTSILYTAAALLSYTSATVVSCLTASAASYCSDSNADPRLQRGRALGGYRSRGQLGRAIGPLLASSVYWVAGPSICYSGLAICLGGVALLMGSLARVEAETARRKVKAS